MLEDQTSGTISEAEAPAVESESPPSAPKEVLASLDQILQKARGDLEAEAQSQPQSEESEAPTLEKQPQTENSEKGIDWKARFNQRDQSFKDTQKWGMQLSNKLAAYEKLVAQFDAEGILDEDAAKILKDATAAPPGPSLDVHPLNRFGPIWSEEMPKIRQYSADFNEDDLDAFIFAFHGLMFLEHPDQVQTVLDELEQYEKEPVRSTRRMLEIGRTYHHDVFKKIKDSGGLTKFHSNVQNEIKKLNTENEKLKQEISKSKKRKDEDDNDGDDNVSATYRLSPGQRASAPQNKAWSIAETLGRAKKTSFY